MFSDALTTPLLWAGGIAVYVKSIVPASKLKLLTSYERVSVLLGLNA